MNVIYTKPNCSFCVKAKQLLQEKSVKYSEIDISDPLIKADFKLKFPHAKTVPQIVIEGINIGGYTDLVKYFEGV